MASYNFHCSGLHFTFYDCTVGVSYNLNLSSNLGYCNEWIRKPWQSKFYKTLLLQQLWFINSYIWFHQKGLHILGLHPLCYVQEKYIMLTQIFSLVHIISNRTVYGIIRNRQTNWDITRTETTSKLQTHWSLSSTKTWLNKLSTNNTHWKRNKMLTISLLLYHCIALLWNKEF